MDSKVEELRGMIEKELSKVFAEVRNPSHEKLLGALLRVTDPHLLKAEVAYCSTLWNQMSWREKVLWWFLNRGFFRKEGDKMRRLAEDHRNSPFFQFGGESPPPLPSVLEPTPKQTLCYSVRGQAPGSLQSLELTITI